MKVIHAYFLLTWMTTVILMVMLQINFLQMNDCKTYRKSPTQYKYTNDTTEQKDTGQSFSVKFNNLRMNSDSHNGNKRIKLDACNKVREKFLHGEIHLSENVTAEDIRNDDILPRLTAGGMYEPMDCRAEEGTAIIIPYRDRPEQLEILIYHLHNLLQRQRLRYGIFVIEMAMPVQFNRGMLANAGFLTANSFPEFTCFIIHDVDLLPVHDHNLYRCGKVPKHLVVRSTKYPTDLPYPFYIGGVLAMTGKQYAEVNGFSNMFFGWGGEDDDMFWRIKHTNLTIERPKPKVGTYVALHHKKDSFNPANPHRKALLHMWKYRHLIDGLNSMNHQRLALEFRPYYTWLIIQCVERSFFHKIPYIEADRKLMLQKEEQRAMQKRQINRTANIKIIKHKVTHLVARRNSTSK